MKIDPLDVLCSEYIRKKALQRVGGCERCLTQKASWKELQWCHFIGRRNKHVRWDEFNSYGLCGACHMYLHSHPLEWVALVTRIIGEEGFDLLQARMRQTGKIDREAIRLYLQEEIKKLEKGEMQ